MREDIQKEGKKTREVVRDKGEKIRDELADLPRQIADEIEARAQRATQIDPEGEKITVAGKQVYDATEKAEFAPDLPVIRCALESVNAKKHTYRTHITGDKNKALHSHDFTLPPDDAFLLEANHFLENDGLRDFRQQLTLESERTFTQRLGNHFFKLIMGDDAALRQRFRPVGQMTNGASGFKFVLDLDAGAELLWRVPWEFLHDCDEFVGLSGKVHVVRSAKDAPEIAAKPAPLPLKILVLVANPADDGEFDSERALAAIQEATDYGRRQGWVEVDYLEDATHANVQQRLDAFAPHVLHYIGHGGKNPPDSKLIAPPLKNAPGETWLALQNDAGDLAPLYGADLQRLLAGGPQGGVQMLVLSGCMTGQTASSDALSGVGTALLKERLPALVVMQYSVLVDTAIQFAKVFYEQVSRGERISRALTRVRQVLAQARGEHRADWGIPALYLRTPGLQLVDPKAKPVQTAASPVGHETYGVNIGDLPVVANFVGRTRELRQLRETARNPQQPVIYLWGLGGIGKTSLTAKLIQKLEQERAIEGRLVIRCDKIDATFAAVAEKLGSFISLQGKAGHAEAGLALQDGHHPIDTRVALLNNAIKARRYLIVLDNFESFFDDKTPQIGHISDAPLQEFFAALFSHNWQSTFLFTCRYRWDVLIEEPGMQRYQCGLPLANCNLLHLPGLSPAQTRMLMRNLPELNRLTFSQQTQVLPLIQGHPHLIHLFNAYLKEHSLETVLRDKNIVAAGGTKQAFALPAKIIEQLGAYFLDGLWACLNENEKDALALLAVFRTSLSEADLVKLVQDKQALQTLRNYSLLQREAETGTSRWQILPAVRGYVESKIDRDKLRACHLQAVDFYVEQEAANFLLPKGFDRWTPDLLAEFAQMAGQQGQRQIAERLTVSLLEMHHHLFVAGKIDRADSIINKIKEFLLMAHREVYKTLLYKSIDSQEGFGKYASLGNLATLLNQEGHWQQALDTHQRCIDYFESIGNKKNTAAGIGQQALVYQERGEYEQAVDLEQKALKIQEEIKDDKGLAIRHYRIAQLLHFMKRYDKAALAGEQALVKAHEIGNQQLQAACLHQIGLTLKKLDLSPQAFEKFQESLVIKEQIGDRSGQANTLGEMGKLLVNAKKYDEALELLQRVLNIITEKNNPIKVAIALEVIGSAFEGQGHFEEALEKYREALRLKKQYSVPPENIARTENNITRVQGKISGSGQ